MGAKTRVRRARTDLETAVHGVAFTVAQKPDLGEEQNWEASRRSDARVGALGA
jgi:hypothetical protein